MRQTRFSPCYQRDIHLNQSLEKLVLLSDIYWFCCRGMIEERTGTRSVACCINILQITL